MEYTNDYWEGYVDCLSDVSEASKTRSIVEREIISQALVEAFDKRERKAREEDG